jgi:ribonuclease HI
MLSWLVLMKYNCMVNQRSTLSISSDRHVAVKDIQAARTMSPWVQQCQQVLNDISIQHVGLYWVPGHAGVGGNKIADRLARDASAQKFVGPEPSLGSLGRI